MFFTRKNSATKTRFSASIYGSEIILRQKPNLQTVRNEFKVDGKTYVFIGLERVGGVMVYDITRPGQPKFVDVGLNWPG